MTHPDLAYLRDVLFRRLPGWTWRRHFNDVLWPPNLAGTLGHAFGIHNSRGCRGMTCSPDLRRTA